MKAALITSLVLAAAIGGAQKQPTRVDPAIDQWEALISTITATSEQKCPGWKPHIIDAAHFSSGVSVALVDSCNGGASTDWITVMHLEGDHPVLSRVLIAKRDIGFVQGASVLHGGDVKLVPEENAIYSIHWDNNEKLRLLDCVVYAYVWHGTSRTFGLDKHLTK
jgi:hypothetical protein